MKVITFFYLCCMVSISVNAQDYSFSVKAESGDTTYTLDIISTISNQTSIINRSSGLDTTTLQQRQYLQIEQAYNKIADAESLIFDQFKLITALRNSLDTLDRFFPFQKVKFDSSFVASFKYRNSSNVNIQLEGQYRKAKNTLLNDENSNSIAVIIPLSSRHIRLRFLDPNFQQGEQTVDLYSSDQRKYVGRDTLNVRHTLLRL